MIVRKPFIVHLALVLLIFIPINSWSQIVAWQFGSATGFETTYDATTNNTYLNTSTIKRVGTIGVFGVAKSFSSNAWSNAFTANQYHEFTVQAKSGYRVSLSTLDVKLYRAATGPIYATWYYSTDGGATLTSLCGALSISTTATQQTQLSLTSKSDLQQVPPTKSIIFRLYAWGGSSTGDAGFGIGTTTGTTNCLAIGGAVEALTLSTGASSLNVSKTINSVITTAVTSNTTWTATSDQSWLTVNSGATGNGTLTCTAASTNPTITTRTATVTLKAVGLTDRTVTVTQAAGDATLSVSAANANVTKAINSSAAIDVTSNTTWTATSDQIWLSVTSGATGNATLTMTTTAANPTITTRSAIVTLKATGAADKTITVTQAIGDPTLSVSANTANVAKTVNSIATIDVTSNSTWSATSDQSWLTVNSGATGNGTLTCTAASTNPTITTRTAIVTLKVTGATDKTVTVTQAVGDATLSVSAATANVTKAISSTANIDVTSNTMWTATSDQNWLTVTSAATGNATLTMTTTAANPTITTRTAIVTLKATGVADKTITVTQAVGDPTLSVSANTANVAKTVNSIATIDVTSNSTWSATSDQSWLTVNSGATGNGMLTCTAASSNPTITTRTAIVTLKATGATDITVTVTQTVGDATLSVSAATANVTKTITSTATIDVTSNTTWTATSDQTWLSVTSGETGNATLTMTTTAANPTIATRTAIVTLMATGAADKTITVTQAVGDPTLSVSANTANVTKIVNSTATIDVTSNSTWTATSDQSWLTVNSGAIGNGTLTCTVASTNPTIITRTTIVTLKATGAANITITITQAVGDPTLSVSATTATVGKAANSIGSVSLTSNTTWIASTDQSWLIVKSSGVGDATLRFSAVSENLLAATRQATITVKADGVSDKNIIVTQFGTAASLTVGATTASIGKTVNSTATVNVASNTSWTASSDQNWLTVTSGATGNATITMTVVTTNPTILTRTAIVTIKAVGATDKLITVTQAAGDPILTVSTISASIRKNLNSTTQVDVTSNSTWTASSNQNWLKVVSGGSGNTTLTFTTTSTNPTISTRQAIVTLKATGVNDKTITITQDAGDPELQVSSTSTTIANSINSIANLDVTSNTSWTTSANQNWLSVSQGTNGDGVLTLTATSANSTLVPRTASVILKATGVTDKIVTVTQDAADPTLTVSSSTVVIDPAANNTALLKITSNTNWIASSDQSWLNLNPTDNSTLTLSASTTSETRQAVLTIVATGVKDTKITVVQSPAVANSYQLNMTLTSVLSLENVEITNENMQVSAYIENESRGTSVLKYDDSNKRYMAYLMIWGNASDVNKIITFKCVNTTDGTLYSSSDQSVKFIPDLITGTHANPYLINVLQESVNIAGVNPVNVSSLTGLTTNSIITVNAGAKFSIDQNISLNKIIVNPGGKLTLNDGYGLTVQSLTLQSDPTGVLHNGTFVDENSGASPQAINATVQLSLIGGRNWYVSSPITGATSSVFSADAIHPIYWYDELHGSTIPWGTISNTSTALIPLKGYVVNLASTGIVTFQGTLNSGAQSITISRTLGQTKEGFNLVGNPYPCYLDWESSNKSNLLYTLWYRTKNSNTYVFDTFNSLAGIGTNNNGKGAVTKDIPPMQAFWVRVAAGKTSGVVSFNNSMRSHTQTTNLLKSKAVNNTSQPTIRIQVSNDVNSDETIIFYNTNATDGFDDYDSPKMTNANTAIPEIYTIAGTEQLSINGLNSIKYNEELPLGFKTDKSNTFTLQATEITGFNSDTKIVLKDKLLNTQQELCVGATYSFNSDVTNTTNRFSLIFKSGSINTEVNQSIIKPEIDISANKNGQLIVSFVNGITGQSDISVYNSAGSLVEKSQLNSSQTILSKTFPSGVYLIKINADGYDYCRKIQL